MKTHQLNGNYFSQNSSTKNGKEGKIKLKVNPFDVRVEKTSNS